MGGALLILDVQKDFTESDARMPVAKHQVVPMIKGINKLIDRANKSNKHIIYIGNEFKKSQFIANWFRNNASLKGSEGASINDHLKVVNNLYFPKSKGDAFSNPRLVDYIRDNQINNVYIVGLFAEGCVLATVKGALKRNLAVSLIGDCIAGANDKKRDAAINRMCRLGVSILDSEIDDVQ